MKRLRQAIYLSKQVLGLADVRCRPCLQSGRCKGGDPAAGAVCSRRLSGAHQVALRPLQLVITADTLRHRIFKTSTTCA